MGVKFTGGFAKNPSFRAGWAPRQVKWVTPASISIPYKQVSVQTFSATGDLPITYANSAGTIPAGLTLTSAGALTGQATTPGTYSFTIRASSPYRYADRVFSYVVSLGAPGPVELITGGTSGSLGNWSYYDVTTHVSVYSHVSVYELGIHQLPPSNVSFLQQTTGKADYGKTYNFNMAWQNYQYDSNPVKLYWTITGTLSGTLLKSGTITASSSISVQKLVGAFVGSEEPVIFRIENRLGQETDINLISLTRVGG